MIKVFLISMLAYGTLHAQHASYDQQLAEELGADDYGMKSYVLVILKSGGDSLLDPDQRSEAFRGHQDNIIHLVEQGKLIVSGPFGKNESDYKGLFLFDVQTVEEAEEWVKTDPAIQSGLLEVELFPWYGSAALPLYLTYHYKIEKIRP